MSPETRWQKDRPTRLESVRRRSWQPGGSGIPLKSSGFSGRTVTSIDTHKPREGAYNFCEMFERYTEKARRAIFSARYEASQFGSLYIETEHLLLGLLREDNAVISRFLCSNASGESIRKQIEDHTTVREKVSTSIDLPLSDECKRVLTYAAEEAERLSQEDIRTEHLLLGLLREEKCFAMTILRESGVTLLAVREKLPPGDQEVGQRQRRWAASARRRY
jgi:ATP-dependent Clp protease ATP-binding subunit ClpA